MAGGIASLAGLFLRETEAKKKHKSKKNNSKQKDKNLPPAPPAPGGGTPACTPRCSGCGGSDGCGGAFLAEALQAGARSWSAPGATEATSRSTAIRT